MPEKSIAAAIAQHADAALAVLIAAFFGFIRYLQEFLDREPPAFKWLIAVAKVLTAGSVGYLVHILTIEWGVTSGYGAFMIAIAGYGGAETLNAGKEAFLGYLRGKASGTSGPGAAD